MGRLIVDAASSLDGFWADSTGQSVIDAAGLHGAVLPDRLGGSIGAVVMSMRSFASAGSADRVADAYPPRTPIFVVCDDVPKMERRGDIRFMSSYTQAFRAAQSAAGDGAVLVVGDASAVKAALGSGEGTEIWLRMVSRTLRRGALLFDDGLPVDQYFVSEIDTTGDAVNMHLERRVTG